MFETSTVRARRRVDLDRDDVKGCLRPIGCGLLVLLLPVFCFVVLYEWPPGYSADPIEARVIDEETQKPIEGAVVVAEWRTESMIVGTGHLFKYQEAVTNRNGVFRIRGWWWPRPHFPTHKFVERDPQLWVFAPGYRMGGGNNAAAGVPLWGIGPGTPIAEKMGKRGIGYWLGTRRLSWWDGKTIPLEPFHDPAEEAKKLIAYESEMNGPPERSLPKFRNAWIVAVKRLPPKHRQTVAEGSSWGVQVFLRNSE